MKSCANHKSSFNSMTLAMKQEVPLIWQYIVQSDNMLDDLAWPHLHAKSHSTTYLQKDAHLNRMWHLTP